MQIWAVLFSINNCKNTLHASDAFCAHHQEYIKTVVTATGACHESGWCISSKDVQGRSSTTQCHSRFRTIVFMYSWWRAQKASETC